MEYAKCVVGERWTITVRCLLLMRISVIVSTYNDTRALDLVLRSLARQSHLPDEVWIADDGSTDETAALVASYSERLDGRLHHVWHADRGHRRGRIANEAVRRSTGDHLIFLDGDSIPHACWVEDHALAARPNTVLCGRRVKLGPELTEQIEPDWVESGRLDSRRFLFGGRLHNQLGRWLLGIRLPAWIPPMMYWRARRLMGVNFSMPRAAFELLNGFEEDNPVGRRDDRELELRMIRNRLQRTPLLHRAIVFHLNHGTPAQSEESRAWLEERRASDDLRARIGLDSTIPFDANA